MDAKEDGNDLNGTENKSVDTNQVTFKSMGVVDVLCEACETLSWNSPTPIQRDVIPLALEGRDIVGVAETGSGKTAAFALPILQALLETPQKLFALVLVPTHELAEQVASQFRALGQCIGLDCVVLVGGHDINQQRLLLGRKPHVIVATPGRMVDHLTNTKGFNLRTLKFLVMDEADRMLSADFEGEINQILTVIPRERRSYLFSATMTSKVVRLKRVSLKNPVKVEIKKEQMTVDKLLQYMLFIPAKLKDVYFVHLLNTKNLSGKSVIVFCDTRACAHRTTLMLRHLSFSAILLHGKMTQEKRSGSLNKFKSKERSILVSTDVCSRGLDIPHVDVIVNLDIPKTPDDYIHRVGRTARAGRSGIAYVFVTQYDVETFQAIEERINMTIPKMELDKTEAKSLAEKISEARAAAVMEMKEMDQGKKGHRKRFRRDAEDGDDETRVAKKKKFGKKNKMKKK